MTSMERSENRRNRIGGQMAGLYDLEETIGEGHYAVVKMARHVFTGEKVAVKVIDKMKLDSATRLQMMQEVRLMKLVQHPYVVRLYEVIDTQTKLYLVSFKSLQKICTIAQKIAFQAIFCYLQNKIMCFEAIFVQFTE